ncbi:MAG: hypothetical protein GX352_07860, partial [Clostridiales bacterium]|nr:hypothetical protein [Clostridiales bacterium]
EADFFEKDFLIKCLKCRFPDVRIEAIKVFRLKRDSWFPHVCPFLEEALEIEPVANIRKRLGRILGKTSGKGSKECRFVEIGDLGIKLSPIDVKLMDSEIAGVFYRDMTVVEGEVEKGDILYLIREPDNQYDEKAVMVTAEDGYLLGYIPREDNPALSAMLDSGERLYALLGSDIVGGRPSISIMLNRPIEEGGNIIPFPGLWQ